jgi:hypothetical protein
MPARPSSRPGAPVAAAGPTTPLPALLSHLSRAHRDEPLPGRLHSPARIIARSRATFTRSPYRVRVGAGRVKVRPGE